MSKNSDKFTGNLVFYWLPPKPKERKKLFKDEQFQLMRPRIRKEA